MNDITRVSGKNASLVEMYNRLNSQGLNIPIGIEQITDGLKGDPTEIALVEFTRNHKF